jgi:hypothetical protein
LITIFYNTGGCWEIVEPSPTLTLQGFYNVVVIDTMAKNVFRMKNLNTRGFPQVIIFVILLMIITVIAWKSCSVESNSMIDRQQNQTFLITKVL